MNSKLVLAVVVVAGLAGGAGASWWYFQKNPGTTNAAKSSGGPQSSISNQEVVVGKSRPPFHLPDLKDKPHDSSEWDGQVLLVNFWASWCPPCVKETPALMKLRETYHAKGMEIIGIALDNKESVVNFTDPLGVEYPILLAEQEGIALSQQYGNRLGALPFSVIVDRKGIIRQIVLRDISYEDAEKLIKPLL